MTKIRLAMLAAIVLSACAAQIATAQTDSASGNTPRNLTVAAPTPYLSAILAENLKKQIVVSRQMREQSYAKLLEGQRYLTVSESRNSAGAAARIAARQSFIKAVELDPKLVEGYAALAELALLIPPGDVNESIAIADLAVKIQPDNFGARRILAFGYTIKSGLGGKPEVDAAFADKAVAQWKEVTRLAPRFAEAWAFLSEFYERANKMDARIEALKRWQSSATPVETRYYRSIMGDGQLLAPESTRLKLGAALIKAKRAAEAITVLSLAIADDPENPDAVDLLKEAVESGDGKTPPATLQVLQRAVFANPNNVALIELLANVRSRNGQFEDAVKFLQISITNLTETDKNSAAALQITLGDIYAGADHTEAAAAAYAKTLKMQGIGDQEVNTEEEREAAQQVFGKIVQVYKNAGKPAQAEAAIERARRILGKDDLFADKQNISLLRETGKKQAALQAVRMLRKRSKDDYSLLRIEASLLTELGRVDEGAALIKPLLAKSAAAIKSGAKIKTDKNSGGFRVSKAVPSAYYDDFTNYIFISGLYNQAKRGSDAIESARQALAVADSEEKKQIAELSRANAEQTAGNYRAAEDILRNLLKKSPRNPVALNNLGYFLLEQNEKLDEAVLLIRQAVSIDPTNASYLDSLGWAYFKLEKFDQAEFYLKDAARSESASAAIFEHLGDVYHKQGKTELAKSAWQRAINAASNAESVDRLKEKMATRGDK